ncbi:MAG: hypothetical protein JSU99_07940 [Nitrospiraceae bacterium]|nr:MAG: hypothetical protein JSU99_07940 [Nitrospiraceae bacterium]
MMSFLRFLIIIFCVTYYFVERVGLFDVSPIPPSALLFSIPMLSASFLFLIITLLSAIRNFTTIKAGGWFLILIVVLLISGLWVSYFTRFSGEVVLTEGQTIYGGHNIYVANTLYHGKFAVHPDIGITLEKLEASFSSDGTDVLDLKGDVTLIQASKPQKKIVLTSGLPKLFDGTWIGIRDFGYSPRYVLKSKDGSVLDSAFMFLKLFPPGSEDSFRLLSPHTYYLQYHPSGGDDGDESYFSFRITRNKDIVISKRVALKEEISFENSRISIDEIRKWTVVSITRDRGAFFYVPALILSCIYLISKVFIIARKIK